MGDWQILSGPGYSLAPSGGSYPFDFNIIHGESSGSCVWLILTSRILTVVLGSGQLTSFQWPGSGNSLPNPP